MRQGVVLSVYNQCLFRIHNIHPTMFCNGHLCDMYCNQDHIYCMSQIESTSGFDNSFSSIFNNLSDTF